MSENEDIQLQKMGFGEVGSHWSEKETEESEDADIKLQIGQQNVPAFRRGMNASTH